MPTTATLLLIFQGMDCAGKDGAIKHVMSGINPAGVEVHAFKKPSSRELDHDFLWRCSSRAPQRGRIGIFNRSYYEEILVVRVHPEILTKYQRVPAEYTQDLEKVWEERASDIANYEDYLRRNGTRTVKFFIHISKEEQTQRLLDRIDRSDKNWKMSLGDIEERKFFPQYQKAFEQAMMGTSTDDTPWYIIPGDDKKNARLIISQVLLHHMRSIEMNYPVVTEDFKESLKQVREALLNGE